MPDGDGPVVKSGMRRIRPMVLAVLLLMVLPWQFRQSRIGGLTAAAAADTPAVPSAPDPAAPGAGASSGPDEGSLVPASAPPSGGVAPPAAPAVLTPAATPVAPSRADTTTAPPAPTAAVAPSPPGGEPAAFPAVIVAAGRWSPPNEDSRPGTPTPRPHFSFAIGAGASIDHSGLVDGRNVAMPAFHVLAGVGDGTLGFESSLMSTQASGRYRRTENSRVDIGVDRTAIDLMLALRPFLWMARDARPHPGGLDRIRRSFTVDVGLTIERVAPGAQSAFRLGNVVAAHADLLHFTDPSDSRSLALRLGVRRMFASPSTVSMIVVSDTVVDTFLSLAAGF
jgi:hypothetical protein